MMMMIVIEAIIMRVRQYCDLRYFLFTDATLCPLGKVQWSPLGGNFVKCVFNAQSQYLLKCKLKLFSSSIVVFRFFHVPGSFQTISISDCFLTMSSANATIQI